MQQTHTHKAVVGRVEAKELVSRRRQSDYSDPELNCSTESYMLSCEDENDIIFDAKKRLSQGFSTVSWWATKGWRNFKD